MVQQWKYPSKHITLENRWVRISAVRPNSDLPGLYAAASLKNNQDDLFKYHVNVPAMDSLKTFEGYLSQKLSLPNEVMYGVFSKRLDRLVG